MVWSLISYCPYSPYFPYFPFFFLGYVVSCRLWVVSWPFRWVWCRLLWVCTLLVALVGILMRLRVCRVLCSGFESCAGLSVCSVGVDGVCSGLASPCVWLCSTCVTWWYCKKYYLKMAHTGRNMLESLFKIVFNFCLLCCVSVFIV
jgi:hypothetical protein